jgi:hypothetical protein
MFITHYKWIDIWVEITNSRTNTTVSLTRDPLSASSFIMDQRLRQKGRGALSSVISGAILLTVALPCIYILKAQTSDSEPLAFLTFTV